MSAPHANHGASRYEAPRSVAEAIGLLTEEPGATVLAGGTDLIVQMRSGLRRPRVIVDVKRIPELVGVIGTATGVRIGAATPAIVLGADPLLNAGWPGLLDSVRLIGSAQIQGRGSIGGNLCNGSPAADTTAALIVNRATLVIAGPSGERVVAAEAFCTGPGKTVLARGELLVAIDLPTPPTRTADAYLRLIPRSEMDIAVAGAAVSLSLDKTGACVAARVALAAVAPTAVLVPDAALALVGSRLDAAVLGRVAAAATAVARPIDDQRGTAAYRRIVAGVLARRAAVIAAERVAGR